MNALTKELEETKTPVTASGERDVLNGLNRVLSEVIEVGLDVKQAHHRVSQANLLHADLDSLVEDLRSWARNLAEEDEARGVSPLDWMTSVAGRTPRLLWSDGPTDGEVRRTLVEHLARLVRQVEEALKEEPEEGIQVALTSLREGVIAHLTALRQGNVVLGAT